VSERIKCPVCNGSGVCGFIGDENSTGGPQPIDCQACYGQGFQFRRIKQLQDQLADSMNAYRDLDKEHQQLRARVRELEGEIEEVANMIFADGTIPSKRSMVFVDRLKQALHPPAEKEE